MNNELDIELEVGEKLKQIITNSPEFQIIEKQQGEEENEVMLEEDVEKVIHNLDNLRNQLFKTKETLIREAIGQMYKGVLIDRKLSIRDGKVFYYKRRYDWLDLENVRETILANIQEVASKISKDNLDVLEFLLDFIYTIKENSRQSDKNIIFNLPKPHTFFSIDRLDEELRQIQFSKVTQIEYYDNRFIFLNDDGTRVYLTDKQKNIILLKYEKELKELLNEHIKEKENKVEVLQKEIEQIKQKAGGLLILAQLRKEEEVTRC